MWRFNIWTTTGLLTIWAAEALAQTGAGGTGVLGAGAARASAPALPAITAGSMGQMPQGWRLMTLPRQTLPITQLRVEPTSGSGPAVALRVEAQASYGALLHELTEPAMPDANTQLRWSWRLDKALDDADLRRKSGDDAALKVCLLFNVPMASLPFGERTRLQLARALSGENLPTATLCYVWDTKLPAGTHLPNAYSSRVHYIVADGADSPLGVWRQQARPIAADFLRAFGTEAPRPVEVLALALGADADNTGGHSLGWISDISWRP